jgi:hypothetical protein
MVPVVLLVAVVAAAQQLYPGALGAHLMVSHVNKYGIMKYINKFLKRRNVNVY